MCTYVCICVYYVFVCIYLCVYIYIYIHTYIIICVQLYRLPRGPVAARPSGAAPEERWEGLLGIRLLRRCWRGNVSGVYACFFVSGNVRKQEFKAPGSGGKHKALTFENRP